MTLLYIDLFSFFNICSVLVLLDHVVVTFYKALRFSMLYLS